MSGGTTVYVKDGVVSLQGEASSLAEKELTTEYAKDIDNVKEVKNEMTIAKTPPAPDSTVSDKIDDASITAQVKSTLFSHRSTSSLHTAVSTADGVVTLSGNAKNDAEKSLVTKLVTDINGVESVINNMTGSASSPRPITKLTGDYCAEARGASLHAPCAKSPHFANQI